MLNPELKALITSQEDILEPETIRQFEPDMSEEDVNQVLALATLHKSRVFWENYNSFEDIVQALNGMVPNPTVLQGTTPEQIWYALEIAHELLPEREFAPEVLKYIEFMFNENGVFIYPSYLPIDNPYFSRAVYLAENGPFPLGETTEEIQAAQYLAIQEYLKAKNQEK
jgi:hypothetical protein